MLVICHQESISATTFLCGSGVFSLLKNTFGDQQQNALHDYVEAALMVQYNKR